VLDQSRSWYFQWDSILLYSDKFYAGDCDRVQHAAFPCTVTCIPLKNYSRHLEGSEWKNAWYSAQPRFLPAMSRSFLLFPNADFFIFADDDTFLFKESIVRKIGSLNRDTPIAVGVKYCAWDVVSADVAPTRPCHPFLQGGAGVILSNALLRSVASELENCSRRFNDADFAGSMRFALCMERVVGVANWTEGEYLVQWASALHSSQPFVEMPSGGFDEAPASFHRMNHSDFVWISQKVYADWFQDGKKYRTSLGLLPLVRHKIPFLRRDFTAEWNVGVALQVDALRKKYEARSGWRVLFDLHNRPSGYEQKYQNGIVMRLISDPSVPKGAILPLNIVGRQNIFEYAISPLEIICVPPSVKSPRY
jgi:hypothetical protein